MRITVYTRYSNCCDKCKW